jgi:hypothetical protein
MTLSADRKVTGKELAEMLFKSLDNKPSNAEELLDSFNVDIKTIIDDSKGPGEIKKVSHWKFAFVMQEHLKSELLLLTLLGVTIREMGFIHKPDYWYSLDSGYSLKVTKLDDLQLDQAERFAETLIKLMAE